MQADKKTEDVAQCVLNAAQGSRVYSQYQSINKQRGPGHSDDAGNTGVTGLGVLGEKSWEFVLGGDR